EMRADRVGDVARRQVRIVFFGHPSTAERVSVPARLLMRRAGALSRDAKTRAIAFSYRHTGCEAECGLASVDQPHAFGLGEIAHARRFNGTERLHAAHAISSVAHC